MATTKVYLKGVNVLIDNIDGIIRYIPTRSARVQPHDDNIQIHDHETGSSKVIELADLQDGDGNGFATMDDAMDYLAEFIGGFNTASGGSGAVEITQQVDGYSNFLPGENVGDLGYSNISEGIKWLSPFPFGGNYYPAGMYRWDGLDWISDRNAIANQLESNTLKNRIRVDQINAATVLGGTIDPSKEYFIDGIIDLGATQITVPAGGINFKGYDFNVSKIISSSSNYTMFVSPVGGSGDIIWQDIGFEVTGASSQLMNVIGATGFEAFEIGNINFNNCTSLGTINNYRQGLELGTGRFGGTPELTLDGNWIGGYFIETSIVRGLVDGAYSLFKAGPTFMMNSRFISNQNIDLNSTVSLLDFSPANFANPDTVQLNSCLISRNGVFDASDNTIVPNISQEDLPSLWRNNVGLPNTFVGGELEITTEVTTVIPGGNQGVFFDLEGVFTVKNLEHFDSPANGQLRNLGSSPREFKAILNMILDSGQNDELDLKIVVWDDSEGVFVDYKTLRRVVNNLQGGRDVAFFNFSDNIILDVNDYVKLQVANVNDTTNIVAELASELLIEER